VTTATSVIFTSKAIVNIVELSQYSNMISIALIASMKSLTALLLNIKKASLLRKDGCDVVGFSYGIPCAMVYTLAV
jgi:hypothetical protein